MSMNSCRLGGLGLSVSAVAMAFGLGSPAYADPYNLVGTVMIGEQACSGIDPAVEDPRDPDVLNSDGRWRKIAPSRFAFFVTSYAGETVGPGDSLSRLRALNPLPGAEETILRTVLDHVQQQVASKNLAPLGAFDASGKRLTSSDVEDVINSPWIVATATDLRCLLPKDPTPPAKRSISFRLRGDVDALAATGDDRKSASAAGFGFDRVRTFLEDGARKETRTYSINAVLGAVLIDEPLTGLTAYSGYELGKERARPAPTLTPPARQSDNDTEILKFGLVGNKLLPLGSSSNRYRQSFDVALDASYLFDLSKKSERVRGRISAGFYSGDPWLGFCKIGGYTDFGNGLWTRCEVDLIGTFNVLTDHGTITPSVKDHFAHLGGRAGGKVFFGNPLDNAAFATGEFMYLRRIDGDTATFPHIKRHKFSLGYRWWRNEDFAFEAKGEIIDGINPDSFEDENSLSLGFGIIF